MRIHFRAAVAGLLLAVGNGVLLPLRERLPYVIIDPRGTPFPVVGFLAPFHVEGTLKFLFSLSVLLVVLVAGYLAGLSTDPAEYDGFVASFLVAAGVGHVGGWYVGFIVGSLLIGNLAVAPEVVLDFVSPPVLVRVIGFVAVETPVLTAFALAGAGVGGFHRGESLVHLRAALPLAVVAGLNGFLFHAATSIPAAILGYEMQVIPILGAVSPGVLAGTVLGSLLVLLILAASVAAGYWAVRAAEGRGTPVAVAVTVLVAAGAGHLLGYLLGYPLVALQDAAILGFLRPVGILALLAFVLFETLKVGAFAWAGGALAAYRGSG